MTPDRSPATDGAAARLPARGNASSTRILLVAVGAGLAIGIATSSAGALRPSWRGPPSVSGQRG